MVVASGPSFKRQIILRSILRLAQTRGYHHHTQPHSDEEIVQCSLTIGSRPFKGAGCCFTKQRPQTTGTRMRMYDRQRMVVTVRYIPGELGAANADDIVWCGGKGITNVVPFRDLSTQHSRLKERCV